MPTSQANRVVFGAEAPRARLPLACHSTSRATCQSSRSWPHLSLPPPPRRRRCLLRLVHHTPQTRTGRSGRRRSTCAALAFSTSALYGPASTSHLAPRSSRSPLANPATCPRRREKRTVAKPNPTSAMSNGSAGSASQPPPPQAAGPPRRARGGGSDPLLIVCRCFGVVTAATALLCVAVNVLSAVQSFRDRIDIFGGVFRCYGVVFSLFVVVIETEWGFIMRFWQIFEYWPARGMLQIFVAVMTKAYPTIHRNELVLLQEIASYMLLACGAVYIISGIFCLGVLTRSRKQKATSREQAAKDLQELEKRREELQALLIAQGSDSV